MSITPAPTPPAPAPAGEDEPVRPTGGATFPWYVILGLVGLDYFSSLAYLPSLALEHASKLAPIAALGVVAITLLGALPIYWYVVGRSPDGRGGVGLLARRFHGWGGKFFILVLLGFIATDFVLTRSLSVSDAATHISANPAYKATASGVLANQGVIREFLPTWARGWFYDMWNEQLVVSVILSMLSFALYFYLLRTLTRGLTSVAVSVVCLYLFLNVIVLGAGAVHFLQHPDLVVDWLENLSPEVKDVSFDGWSMWAVVVLALFTFPPMAIGLSGFELSLATAPMINPDPGDTKEAPGGRIRSARFLMLSAAIVMSVFIMVSVSTVTLLVDPADLRDPASGEMKHRALAYLAHGGRLIDHAETGEEGLSVIFGSVFGTLYDLVTVSILCLAGASATISLRDLVPDFLARFGMQLQWAYRIGVITHLFNGVILLVTVAFAASVEAQQWAYAASVIALLFGASVAATLDVRARIRGSLIGWPVQIPFIVVAVVFGLMGLLITYQKASGTGIALLFVLTVFITAMVSRWLRSTELRFTGFDFANDYSQKRWEAVCQLDFQIIAPYTPGDRSIQKKKEELLQVHRIPVAVPILFVEVYLGDTSDFTQKPVMEIVSREGEEVLMVSRCTSIPHVLAAIGLEFRQVGQPPEFHFGWSMESPLAATLSFVLFGHGNIPWMVHALMHKAEPDPARRPRVIVG